MLPTLKTEVPKPDVAAVPEGAAAVPVDAPSGMSAWLSSAMENKYVPPLASPLRIR